MQIGQTEVALGGNFITAVDGEPIGAEQNLTLYLDTKTRVGETVPGTILRTSWELNVPVTQEERPQDQ